MRDLLNNLIYLILICLSSQISFEIPFSPIPLTAQSLIIFIVAGLVRPKFALILLPSYLILGAIGLPVFAEGTSGFQKIIGTSGGFLYGFLFSAVTISYLVDRTEEIDLLKFIGIMLIGTMVLFIFGLLHLSLKLSFEKALEYGLYPFWKMALVKALLAAISVYAIKTFSKKAMSNVLYE